MTFGVSPVAISLFFPEFISVLHGLPEAKDHLNKDMKEDMQSLNHVVNLLETRSRSQSMTPSYRGTTQVGQN